MRAAGCPTLARNPRARRGRVTHPCIATTSRTPHVSTCFINTSNTRRQHRTASTLRPRTLRKSSRVLNFFRVLIFVAAGSRRSALLTADRPSRTFAMDRESLERNVNAHIERVVTRAFDLAPARAALGTADRARTAGNASFRAGDFTMAIEAYSQGMVVLRRDATHEPATMSAAERALLALLANSAQCALKLGDHQSAIDLATDALGIHACPSEPGLFKKLMVRLALARDAAGDTDAAIATCEEAQLRGMHATEFDDIMRAAKRTNLGALHDGQEPRMFVMLGLRLSNGAENLARIRGVVENGQLPHVDRRDEGGNNILWGTLQALAIDESTNEKLAGAGGPGCVPTLAYLYAAGADPCQRYDGGKTPLMFTAGSGIVDAVVATLEAMRSRRKALNAEVPGSNPPGDASSIAEWVDVADDGGWTPLMVSLMTKDEASTGVATEEEGHAVLKVVRELLDAGANPGLQNVDGKFTFIYVLATRMTTSCFVYHRQLAASSRRHGWVLGTRV